MLDRRTLLAGVAGFAGAAVVGGVAAAAPGGVKGRKPKPTPTPTPTSTVTECVETPATISRCQPASTTPGNLIFSDDFSTGNFFKWGQLQWKAGAAPARNGDGNLYDGTSEYSGTVANGGAGHEQAARFELRNGDIPFSTTERTEISNPGPDLAAAYPVANDIFRMEWDMMFDAAFPVSVGGWCIPWQWHGEGATSSPPICLDIDYDDIIYLANNDPSGYQRTAVQSLVRGTWQHWRIDAKFHDNAATGWAEVSIDGVVVLAQHSRATLVPGEPSNYFKCGLYRHPDHVDTMILWHDNIVFTAL